MYHRELRFETLNDSLDKIIVNRKLQSTNRLENNPPIDLHRLQISELASLDFLSKHILYNDDGRKISPGARDDETPL